MIFKITLEMSLNICLAQGVRGRKLMGVKPTDVTVTDEVQSKYKTIKCCQQLRKKIEAPQSKEIETESN